MGFFDSKKKKPIQNKLQAKSQAKTTSNKSSAASVVTTKARNKGTATATPTLTRNTTEQPKKEDPLLIEKRASSDEDMLIIERQPQVTAGPKSSLTPMELQKNLEEPSSPAKSTTDIEAPFSTDTYDSLRDVGYMNHPGALVNGQLVQWVYAVEEGPFVIRMLGFLAAIAMIVTTVYPYYVDRSSLTYQHIILSVLTIIASCYLVILDGRMSLFSRNPMGCRARMRNAILSNAVILKVVWGRGLLYLLIGLLHIAQGWLIALISGGVSILVAVVMIIFGLHASHNLYRLRSSMTNDEFLWLEFSRHDYDNDGFVDLRGFANFLFSIGLEFDDRRVIKSFNSIDEDNDGKITFEEFRMWWSECNDDFELEESFTFMK